MKKRYKTPQEIIAEQKRLAGLKQRKYKLGYATCGTMYAYALWKKEGFTQGMIRKYSDLVNGYWENFSDELVSRVQTELKKKAEIELEVEQWEDYEKPKDYQAGYLWEMKQIDNQILRDHFRYNVCHYAALLDMGWGKKRLVRIADETNEYLQDESIKKKGVDMMWKELVEELGVFYDRPDIQFKVTE